MVRRRGAAIADLLDWQPPQVAVSMRPEQVRASSLNSRISKAVSAALKASGKPREEIAAAMSDILGTAVTVAMLHAYASEAKDGHRITLERFIALVGATGCHDLLGFVCEPFGFAVVPDRYVDVIELHQVEEHLAEIQARQNELKARSRRTRP